MSGGKFFLRRHFEVAVLIRDGAQEQAGGRVAGCQGRPGIASGLPSGAMIQTESALDFVSGTMALITMFHEQRPDLVLEVLQTRRCLSRDRARDQQGQEESGARRCHRSGEGNRFRNVIPERGLSIPDSAAP